VPDAQPENQSEDGLVMFRVDELRKHAGECLVAAQHARPHHRRMFLDLASKFLELADMNSEAQAVLDECPDLRKR